MVTETIRLPRTPWSAPAGSVSATHLRWAVRAVSSSGTLFVRAVHRTRKRVSAGRANSCREHPPAVHLVVLLPPDEGQVGVERPCRQSTRCSPSGNATVRAQAEQQCSNAQMERRGGGGSGGGGAGTERGEQGTVGPSGVGMNVQNRTRGSASKVWLCGFTTTCAATRARWKREHIHVYRSRNSWWSNHTQLSHPCLARVLGSLSCVCFTLTYVASTRDILIVPASRTSSVAIDRRSEIIGTLKCRSPHLFAALDHRDQWLTQRAENYCRKDQKRVE